MINIYFLYTIYIFAIVLHLSSAAIVAFFIIPLQVKEARVRNGLAKLRIQLLIFGVTVFSLGLLGAIILSTRFFISGSVAIYLTLFMIVLHGLGFLSLSVVGHRMYTQQYTDESKRLHEEIADRKGEK